MDSAKKKATKASVEKVCRTCTWWTAPMHGRGTCKEGPPVAGAMVGHSAWPMTDQADWCGRHRPSPATIEELNARLEAEKDE